MIKLYRLPADTLQEANVIDLSTDVRLLLVERLHVYGNFNNYGLKITRDLTFFTSDYEVVLVVFPEGVLQNFQECKDHGWAGPVKLPDGDIAQTLLDIIEDMVRLYPYAAQHKPANSSQQ